MHTCTAHGKMLLAQMHRELSHCESSGDHLRNEVLNAVQFRPHDGHWQDSGTSARPDGQRTVIETGTERSAPIDEPMLWETRSQPAAQITASMQSTMTIKSPSNFTSNLGSRYPETKMFFC